MEWNQRTGIRSFLCGEPELLELLHRKVDLFIGGISEWNLRGENFEMAKTTEIIRWLIED
jgi:hypothetical protein